MDEDSNLNWNPCPVTCRTNSSSTYLSHRTSRAKCFLLLITLEPWSLGSERGEVSVQIVLELVIEHLHLKFIGEFQFRRKCDRIDDRRATPSVPASVIVVALST